MLLVFVSSFFLLLFLDRQLTKILSNYIDNEAERITTGLVNQALNELKLKEEYHSLLLVEKDDEGKIERISYDTSLMNQISSQFNDKIQEKLKQLEEGKIDDLLLSDKIHNGKFHHIKNGILCEVSLSSLRESHLFSNVGPVIPIRLLFLGQVMPDIDIKVKEYGINNIMVEIYFVAAVKEQITMPFSSKRREVVVNQLLSVDIIRGEIPNYYNGFSK